MKQFQLVIPEDKVDVVTELLEDKLQIRNISKVHTATNVIILFQCTNSLTKQVASELEANGISTEYGLMSVLPLEISQPLGNEEHRDAITGASGQLSVEEIYCNTATGSILNLDFCLMIIMAGIIAAVGLASNNSVSVVAAMLVSPMMGPILGMSLGGIVRDKKLFYTGLVTELAALLICVVVGCCFGLAMGAFARTWQWPTVEMQSRGDLTGLALSAIVASASGVGVGVAVTKGETVGLVGVGIAASLLPPAVNSGINFAFSFFSFFSSYPISFSGQLRIAGISFCLTLLNIGLIFAFSMITFKFKCKLKPASAKKNEAWRDLPRLSRTMKDDLYNRTIGHADNSLTNTIMNAFHSRNHSDHLNIGGPRKQTTRSISMILPNKKTSNSSPSSSSRRPNKRSNNKEEKERLYHDHANQQSFDFSYVDDVEITELELGAASSSSPIVSPSPSISPQQQQRKTSMEHQQQQQQQQQQQRLSSQKQDKQPINDSAGTTRGVVVDMDDDITITSSRTDALSSWPRPSLDAADAPTEATVVPMMPTITMTAKPSAAEAGSEAKVHVANLVSFMPPSASTYDISTITKDGDVAASTLMKRTFSF